MCVGSGQSSEVANPCRICTGTKKLMEVSWACADSGEQARTATVNASARFMAILQHFVSEAYC